MHKEIDFKKLASLSTFQRFIVEVVKHIIPGFRGVPSRGKKTIMAQKFNERLADYKEVLAELKERLKERENKML